MEEALVQIVVTKRAIMLYTRDPLDPMVRKEIAWLPQSDTALSEALKIIRMHAACIRGSPDAVSDSDHQPIENHSNRHK